MAMQSGTYKYQAKIEMGGQSMPLNYSTEIKEENGVLDGYRPDEYAHGRSDRYHDAE